MAIVSNPQLTGKLPNGNIIIAEQQGNGAIQYIELVLNVNGTYSKRLPTSTGVFATRPLYGISSEAVSVPLQAYVTAFGSLEDVTVAAVSRLAAPTGVIAYAANGQNSIIWNAVSGSTGYVVRASQASGGPYYIAAFNIPATSFADTNIVNGQAYYYVVTALNTPIVESVYSTEVSATPLITNPLPTHWNLVSGASNVTLTLR